MFVIKYQKVFIAFSGVLVALSLTAIAVFGLPLGIDFTGGSALELRYDTNRPTALVVSDTLAQLGFDDAIVQPVGEQGMMIKTVELTEADRALVVAALAQQGESFTQESFTAIGPSVGRELAQKAIISVVLVLISIVCFVAYAFRGVSKPVSSWKYGFATILALAHDIVIPTGFFAVFAHYTGAELDTLFIVALLTTLALSVSDTIVVFDRVRENLKAHPVLNKPFARVVGESLGQTYARSINTSIMVLVVVICLAVFGPVSTKLFATILAIGMFFGTYSSVFLASPLLVLMERLQKKHHHTD